MLGIDSDVRVGGLLVLLLLLLVLLLLLRVLRLEARRRRWWKRWCRGGLDVGAARGRTESRIYDMLSTHSVAVCPSAPSASVGSVSRYRIARVDGRLHQGQGKRGPASRAVMERILSFFPHPHGPCTHSFPRDISEKGVKCTIPVVAELEHVSHVSLLQPCVEVTKNITPGSLRGRQEAVLCYKVWTMPTVMAHICMYLTLYTYTIGPAA